MISKIIRNTIPALFSTLKTTMGPIPKGIQYKIDAYNSIHLTLPDTSICQQQFQTYITSLTNKQEHQNKEKQQGQQTNAIWIHLKQQSLNFASFLCKNGFKIHSGVDYGLVMYKWISRRSMLAPPFSNFHISCGSIIVNKGSILLVQEKFGPRKGQYGIPGGRADIGEYIENCSERQLWQQTGIKAKFKSIVYFRQFPIMPGGQMDLYFACLMDYEEESIKKAKFCLRQLSDHKWVPLQQYRQFAKQNSWGTQRQVAMYLCDLHDKGFDFNVESKKCPKTIGFEYISPRDHIKRYVMEHRLI